MGAYIFKFGTGSRTRTGTMSPSRDFESRVSTNSAIPATISKEKIDNKKNKAKEFTRQTKNAQNKVSC